MGLSLGMVDLRLRWENGRNLGLHQERRNTPEFEESSSERSWLKLLKQLLSQERSEIRGEGSGKNLGGLSVFRRQEEEVLIRMRQEREEPV